MLWEKVNNRLTRVTRQREDGKEIWRTWMLVADFWEEQRVEENGCYICDTDEGILEVVENLLTGNIIVCEDCLNAYRCLREARIPIHKVSEIIHEYVLDYEEFKWIT